VADFVIFTTVGHGEVAVLMTPATPVRFEQQEHSDEQIAAFVLSEPEWVL
jgi:hypothetical protein